MARTETKTESPKKKRRFQPVKYFKEVIAEMKKVTWPSRKELISHTGAVFAFVIGMAIAVGLLDVVFTQGVALLARIGS
ncbi:preprotein translocase subunit SecE [Christensenellaceae bacterium OttesenSCG-928-L17]|nr:preprotein translocase subunit SecE [Christensenellaceae bacterium OttesenSCG-928-L17]